MWKNFAFIFNIRDLNSRFPKSFIGQSHYIIGQKRIFSDIKEFCDDYIVMITNDYIVMTTFLQICTEIKVLFLCVRKHSYISISIKNHGVELSCFRRTVPEKKYKASASDIFRTRYRIIPNWNILNFEFPVKSFFII